MAEHSWGMTLKVQSRFQMRTLLRKDASRFIVHRAEEKVFEVKRRRCENTDSQRAE